MAKFHGKLGYIHHEETSPGVYVPIVTEILCQGDILRNYHRWDNGENVNSDINLNNRFSIIGDAYANENIDKIRYLEWNGIKWAVGTIDIDSPRLILTVRGVYNG